MNKITRISLTLIAIFFFNTFAFGDYKERMKARLPQIISAKSAGTIGEGVDGLLHLRVESDEATTGSMLKMLTGRSLYLQWPKKGPNPQR